MRTLEHYLKLPYTTVVRQDDDGDFVARIEELPGCIAHGASPKEAFDNVQDVKKAWLEESINADLPIPEPAEAEARLPSGKWVQRVPRTLHRKLVRCAAREGVSLNQWVVSVLAEAVGFREGHAGGAITARAPRETGMSILLGHPYNFSECDESDNNPWEVFQADVKPTTVFHGGIVESLRNVHCALLPKKGRKPEALKDAEKKEANQYFAFEH